MNIYSQNNLSFQAKLKFDARMFPKTEKYAQSRLDNIAKAFEEKTANSFPKGEFGFYKLYDNQNWFFYSKQDARLYHNGCIGTFSNEGLENLFNLKDNEIVEKLNDIINADRQIQYMYQKDLLDACQQKSICQEPFDYIVNKAKANMMTIFNDNTANFGDTVFRFFKFS